MSALEAERVQVHLSTFFAFRDVQPDRWGTRLLESAERRAARAEGRRPKRLSELDIPLRIGDETRQGALRFARPGEPAGQAAEIASAEHLPWIAAVTGRIESEDQLDEEALRLLPTGTGAGGARPKFTVRTESGLLSLAKLPSRDDRRNVARWEVAASMAARQAGVDASRMRHVAGHGEADGTSLVQRFDRADDGRRIGYRSGAGLLQLSDATDCTYAQLVTAALAASEWRPQVGAELFRRVAFTVLVNNADDHARNHGFLRAGVDWEPAPAFDINPHPGVLESTPIDRENDPEDRDLRRLFADRDRYGLTLDQARSSISAAAEAAARVPEHAPPRSLGQRARALRRVVRRGTPRDRPTARSCSADARARDLEGAGPGPRWEVHPAQAVTPARSLGVGRSATVRKAKPSSTLEERISSTSSSGTLPEWPAMLMQRLLGYILHLSLNQITLYSKSHRLGVF
ncbi:type II toxin-antitoxin system HipA family toxin [Kocuria palustris]|uniref:type II toxin-antitoxin system HipA family toxin n=1 Tax=Kocuria palustris TaxID=71999 RepID=UPI0024330111|nr:HipA domain-containing protein [Kocuria palustris]